MLDILSIGDTMQDVFLEMSEEDARLHCTHHPETCELCFNYADKIPVQSKHDLIGGNSANAAIAWARLGFRSAIYTHVGGDRQGERIIQEFARNRVVTDYIVVDKDKESNYNTVINLHAERTILIYHVHRDYRLPNPDAAQWAYLSSMSEGFEKILPDLCAYVDAHKIRLCYQPGTFQLRYGAEASKELLQRTEIFMVNKEEAELFTGIEKGENNFRQLLDGIRALGPKIAVVTDGTKGAYTSDGKDYLFLGIIPFSEAPRVEATGAGDAFSAAFAAAISQGEDLGEALRWGQCESSSVIGQIGPQAGLLFRKQLAELLARHAEDLLPTAMP